MQRGGYKTHGAMTMRGVQARCIATALIFFLVAISAASPGFVIAQSEDSSESTSESTETSETTVSTTSAEEHSSESESESESSETTSTSQSSSSEEGSTQENTTESSESSSESSTSSSSESSSESSHTEESETELSSESTTLEEQATTGGEESGTSTIEVVGEEDAGANTTDAATSTATTTEPIFDISALETPDASDEESGAEESLLDATGTAVTTGDSSTSANVINVINTNIINSTGLLEFLQNMLGGDYDLSGLFSSVFSWGETAGTSGCSLEGCDAEGTSFTATSTNFANISNVIIARSMTGGNGAFTSTGDASIATGDAYASVSAVNIANTNVINSNYLLIGIDNIGELLGDVILPGKDFFTQLLAAQMGVGGAFSIANDNTAVIDNNVIAEANTGDNYATSTTGTSTILTGDAQASANVTNIANTNLIGGSTIYLLFRIYGDWGGKVFGLPEGMTWAETEGGIVLLTRSGAGLGTPSASAGAGGATAISNTNTAAIANDIQVYALTGENHAEGTNASITTGNAYASANILNVVNTNVVGHNWIFAIFNIFGDWKGNIAFGRPDLWIGAQASAGAYPGAAVDYTFTVSNLGNADATNVMLGTEYDGNLLTFTEGIGEYTEGGTAWSLGNIAAGETREITYVANITTTLPIGSTPITLLAEVHGDEPDADLSDNTEEITIVAQNGSASGNSNIIMTPPSDLSLEKTSSMATVTPPAIVDYTLTITNEGAGPAYYAQLTDILTYETGEVLHDETWYLGTIAAGEEVVVTYTVEFTEGTPAGVYSNGAQVHSITLNPSTDPFYGNFDNTEIQVNRIRVNGAPVETSKVEAVIEEDLSCGAYLTEYIGVRTNSNPTEVRKLQMFLRDIAHLSVPITGIFGAETERAVVAYQERYRDAILTPWGIARGTGYVYYTTQKHINEQYCEDGTAFNLSPSQLAEILEFRARTEATQRTGQPLPDTSEVGAVDTDSALALGEAKLQETQNVGDTNERRTQVAAAALSASNTTLFDRIFETVASWFSYLSSVLAIR